MGRGDGRGGMLQAQKNALRATLTENVLQLQERELTYFCACSFFRLARSTG